MKPLSLTPATILALCMSHCPQPTRGHVEPGLYVARASSRFLLWDSLQTAGYLCATESPSTLSTLLALENAHPGSVRALITETTPLDLQTMLNLAPPHPGQDTFDPPARIDTASILAPAPRAPVLRAQPKPLQTPDVKDP